MSEVEPLVSVAITVYNNGDVLAGAVRSVQAQTLSHVELLLWDDGSTDAATLHELDRLRDSGITVLRGENQGVVGARNSAARHTRGRFLSFLDPDDRIRPTYLEKALHVLHGWGADIAYPWAQLHGDKSGLWAPSHLDRREILLRNTVPVCAVMRRRVIELTGGFSHAMDDGYEDWDLWAHASSLGLSGRVVPEPLFDYTYSESTGRDSDNRLRHDDIAARIRQRHAADLFAPAPTLDAPSADDVGTIEHLMEHRRFPLGVGDPLVMVLPIAAVLGTKALTLAVSAIAEAARNSRTVAVVREDCGAVDQLHETLTSITPFVYRLGNFLRAGDEQAFIDATRALLGPHAEIVRLDTLHCALVRDGAGDALHRQAPRDNPAPTMPGIPAQRGGNTTVVNTTVDRRRHVVLATQSTEVVGRSVVGVLDVARDAAAEVDAVVVVAAPGEAHAAMLSGVALRTFRPGDEADVLEGADVLHVFGALDRDVLALLRTAGQLGIPVVLTLHSLLIEDSLAGEAGDLWQRCRVVSTTRTPHGVESRRWLHASSRGLVATDGSLTSWSEVYDQVSKQPSVAPQSTEPTVFFSVPDWDAEEALDDVLTAFCGAFDADDDVSLVLGLDPDHGLTLEDGYERAAQALRRVGAEDESCPDIVISSLSEPGSYSSARVVLADRPHAAAPAAELVLAPPWHPDHMRRAAAAHGTSKAHRSLHPVVVKLMGGLGNQMFQYAAGRALALRHDLPLVLDARWFAEQDKRSYELGALGIVVDDIVHDDEAALRHGLDQIPTYEEAGFTHTALTVNAGTGVVLEGYFQSSRHFDDRADVIRHELTPALPADDAAMDVRNRMAQASAVIAVHVRRGDYVSESDASAYHGVCEPSYYRRALALLRRLHPAALHVLFSDDPQWAREHIVDDADWIVVEPCEGRSPAQDMALMARAGSMVIANSSFSWWAAWLSGGADVVAPRPWFTAGVDARDLYAPSWMTVDNRTWSDTWTL